MKFLKKNVFSAVVCLLLLLVVFAQGMDSLTTRFHLGFYASSGYIKMWHLEDVVYVKDSDGSFVTDDGQEGVSHQVQYITGVQGMGGVNFGLGVAAAYDVTTWMSLHGNLYLSCRYRFTDTKEYHYKISELMDGDQISVRDSTFGSKGNFDITLTYWHLDLPLTARFYVPGDFYIEGGTLVSYILAANFDMNLLSVNMNSYAAGVELGALSGIGRRFVVGNRNVDVFGKFSLGLTPLLTDSVKKFISQCVHPREWLVEVGMIFWIL